MRDDRNDPAGPRVETPPSERSRLPYERPRLKRLGTAAELTKALNTGASDGIVGVSII